MKSTIIRNVMTVLLALFSLHVSAQTFSYNGLEYKLNGLYGNTATVIKDYNSSGFVINITIPSSIEYGGKQYSVTSISPYAFQDRSSLTSVTIPNSVTSIGKYAFEGCSSLTSVVIPNSVTSIEEATFRNCSGLTSVTIPSSVNNIGASAFKGCSGLTSVTIPNNVTSIGKEAFSGCSGLTSVVIPNSVTSIEEATFNGCSALTSVVSEIENPFALGTQAFTNISEQCVLTVPKGTKDAYIAKGWTTEVFKGGVVEVGQTSVEAIKFADAYVKALCVVNWDTNNDGELDKDEAAAVTDLGEVFKDNTTITSFNELRYFTALTSIGKLAFSCCSGLTSVTIPNSVESIGEEAFSGCSGLTSVTIPNSVTSIGQFVFFGCSGLTSVTIPNSVTSIEDGAFAGCSGLTSVTIPNSVTSIGQYAFSDCYRLTSVTIPNSVTSIGKSAFRYCINMTSVTIPNSVTSIGNQAFNGCSGLTSVTIPNSVTTIGALAFNKCSGLTSVISEIENPFVFGSSAFSDIASTCTLTVPAGTRDAYIAAGWTEDVFKGGIVEAPYNPVSDNYLTISNAEVCKGRSIVFPVSLSNTKSITVLQFEIALPTGVTISKCQLTDRKGEDHSATYKKLTNGNYQVTVISLSKALFSGTEGALVNLTLDAADNMTADDYDISLTNIELTTSDTQAINPVDVTATLTVSDVKIADADGNGKVSITDAVAIVSHILGDDIDGFVAAAADVDGNGRITITDAVAVVDMILNGSASAKGRAGMDEEELDPQ